MKKIILFSAFIAFAYSTFSQSTSWTGVADSTWHNAANWTAGVPANSIDAVIGDANYTGAFQPSVSQAATCRALTISAGFKLNVYTNDTIKLGGNLTNNGLIQGDSASFVINGANVTLTGSGTAVYNNLCVLPGVNCTINKNIALCGNLIVDGSLSAIGKTVTFTGSQPSIISGSGSITLGNLVQNKTGSFTQLQSPVTVMDTLTLTTGVIRTSSAGLLTLADNAISTSGSTLSYVDGPMQKIGNDVFVFPLGNNGVWARLIISAPALTSDAFTAQYFAAPYANTDSIAVSTPAMNNVSKVEYWTCERSAGTSDVSVTLYWEDNLRSDFSDFSNLVVARWNGSAWENEGQAGIIPLPQGNITSTVQGFFGPFTFGSISNTNPMPIELLNFSAKPNAKETVDLTWETATETNNNYFTVEKSQDGVNYEAAGIVTGSGTSLVKHSYAFADHSPYKGLSYYRLKQTDYNGKFTYSPVQVVQLNLRDGLSVFPNPSSGTDVTVTLGATGGTAQLILINAVGQEVFFKELDATDGLRYTFDQALSPGVYTLLVGTTDTVSKQKLVVK